MNIHADGSAQDDCYKTCGSGAHSHYCAEKENQQEIHLSP